MRFCIACVISFFFFIVISLLHAMFDVGSDEDDNKDGPRKVLIEMVQKPPEKKPKKARPRVRKVTQSDQNKSLGNKMAMKLIPDLSVDAGVGGDGDGAGVVQVKNSQDLQAEVFEVGETDEPPMPMSVTPVAYPLAAREKGVEGKLVAYFVVGRNGKVKSIDIRKSPSPIFTREAKRTIKTWRFKPGKKSGVPVQVRMKKEFNFVIQK